MLNKRIFWKKKICERRGFYLREIPGNQGLSYFGVFKNFHSIFVRHLISLYLSMFFLSVLLVNISKSNSTVRAQLIKWEKTRKKYIYVCVMPVILHFCLIWGHFCTFLPWLGRDLNGHKHTSADGGCWCSLKIPAWLHKSSKKQQQT